MLDERGPTLIHFEHLFDSHPLPGAVYSKGTTDVEDRSDARTARGEVHPVQHRRFEACATYFYHHSPPVIRPSRTR